MATKRKYTCSADDHMESQTSRKRNRHSKKDKIAAPYDDCSDYDSVPKCNRRSQRSASKPSRVQNVEWSLLPGELRNKIYEYAMMGEKENVLNVQGKLTGRVEPIYCGTSLSGNGFDALPLLQLRRDNPDFYIHFPLACSLDHFDFDHFNQIHIINDIERSSKHQPKALIANAGLIGIQVTPVASDSGASSVPTDVDADLPPANDTLLKLKID
ncbi:hypothetical protein CFE70_006121 [Pyrenophora teres f. teres 0-1]